MMARSEFPVKRLINFACLPLRQAEQAMQLLRTLEDLEVELGPGKHCITVGYDLCNHTLERLETLLTNHGFHLDNSLLQRIRRALICHSEKCQLENLGAPTREDRLRWIYLNSGSSRQIRASEADDAWRDYF